MENFQTIKFYLEGEKPLKEHPTFIKGVHDIIMPTDYLLPFQIKRESSPNPITSIEMKSSYGSNTVEIKSLIAPEDLQLVSFVGQDYIIHYGEVDLLGTVPAGTYNLVIKDGVNTWTSDDIRVKGVRASIEKDCNVVRIEYRDSCDLGGVFYRTQSHGILGAKEYKNVYYANNVLTVPEYKIKEEGEEDLDGHFILEYARYEKQQRLDVVVPEYLADMINSLGLHSDVNLYGASGHIGKVERVSVETSWNTELWAEIKATLVTNIITKRNCCAETGLVPIFDCITTNATAVATLVLNSPEYNSGSYLSLKGGQQVSVSLQNGDLVLVRTSNTSNEFLLKEYNSGNYTDTNLNEVDGFVVENANVKSAFTGFRSVYMFKHPFYGGYWFEPTINSAIKLNTLGFSGFSDWKIKGETFITASTHIYLKFFNDSESFLQVIDTETFISLDVTVTIPNNVKAIKIKCFGASGCYVGESPWKTIVILDDHTLDGFINGPGGISRMRIGDGFEVGGSDDTVN